MEDAPQVHRSDHLGEWRQDRQPVPGRRRRDQGEDAVGGQAHNHVGHGVHDLGHRLEEVRDAPSPLPGEDAGYPEEQGEHDDLKHVGLDHRVQGIGGEDVQNDVRQGLGLLGRGRHALNVHPHAGLDEVAQRQPDHDRHRRREEVEHQRLDPYSPQLPRVPDGRGARDQGGEHQRDDEHLQKREEDLSDYIQRRHHEVLQNRTPRNRRADRKAEHNAQDEPDADLPEQGHTSFVSLTAHNTSPLRFNIFVQTIWPENLRPIEGAAVEPPLLYSKSIVRRHNKKGET